MQKKKNDDWDAKGQIEQHAEINATKTNRVEGDFLKANISK